MAKAVAADNITVNAISLGTIRSATLEERFRQVAKERGLVASKAQYEDIEHAVLPLFAQVPSGRVGRFGEIADAVAFLASSLAGYIAGVNLPIDGGLSPTNWQRSFDRCQFSSCLVHKEHRRRSFM